MGNSRMPAYSVQHNLNQWYLDHVLFLLLQYYDNWTVYIYNGRIIVCSSDSGVMALCTSEPTRVAVEHGELCALRSQPANEPAGIRVCNTPLERPSWCTGPSLPTHPWDTKKSECSFFPNVRHKPQACGLSNPA